MKRFAEGIDGARTDIAQRDSDRPQIQNAKVRFFGEAALATARH